MLTEAKDWLLERTEEYRKTADFEMGVSPSGLEDHYEIGDEKMRKDAALYSLQLAFDAWADEELDRERYEEIEAMAFDHVREYYCDEELETDLEVPDLDRTTARFRYHGEEELFEERYEDEGFEEVDRIVAVASSGIEPGMVAAALTETDYHIVRYSHRRLDDDTVIDPVEDYGGEEVALVDDEAYTGTTIETVRRHLEDRGAEVREEPVRDTRRTPLRERLADVDWRSLLPG